MRNVGQFDSVNAGAQMAVKAYLQRFNAGFRLEAVASVNNRGGSSASYNVLINNVSVALTGG